MPATYQMAATPPQFTFVNYVGHPHEEAKKSAKQVRNHVMHNYIQKQRKRRMSYSQKQPGQTAPNGTQPVKSWCMLSTRTSTEASYRNVLLPWDQNKNILEELDYTVLAHSNNRSSVGRVEPSGVVFTNGVPYQDVSSQDTDTMVRDDYEPLVERPSSPFLRTILGQGRRDPFASFARTTTAREDFWIDQYVHATDCLAVYKVDITSLLQPYRHITFAPAVQDEVTLYATFAYISWAHANLSGQADLWLETANFQTEALRLINARLGDPARRVSDGTIIAVIGMLAIIMWPGKFRYPVDKTGLQFHIQGLRRMILMRGGFPVVGREPTLSWVLHWMDVKCAGEISAGLTPLSKHAPRAPTQLRTPEAGLEANSLTYLLTAHNVRLYAEEFVGALQDFSCAARDRRMAASSTSDNMYQDAYVHWLLRAGSQIRRLLTEAAVSGAVACTATLFLLNIVSWNYLTSLRSGLDYFSKRIEKATVDGNLDRGGCIDPFLWSLIVDPRNVLMADLENVWLLSRLLWIEKRLDGELRGRIRAALLQFLFSEGEGAEDSIWSPEQFRAAVFQDLGLNTEM